MDANRIGTLVVCGNQRHGHLLRLVYSAFPLMREVWKPVFDSASPRVTGGCCAGSGESQHPFFRNLAASDCYLRRTYV